MTILWIFKYSTWLYLFNPCCRLSGKQPLYPAALCHLYVNWVTLLTITLKCLNILMVFAWEQSAKNNSPALSLCGSMFLPCFGAKILAQTTYLQLQSFFHYLSFIAVLSPYLPGSEASGLHVSRIYHSDFLSGTSKPTTARVDRSVCFFPPGKQWEYWVPLLEKCMDIST